MDKEERNRRRDRRNWILLILTILLFAGLYFFYPGFKVRFLFLIKSTIEYSQSGHIAQEISEEIFSPPLRGTEDSKSAKLNAPDVITLTNAERTKNGNALLKENTLLDNAAQAKLQDMFNQQYFEHVSPQGN